MLSCAEELHDDLVVALQLCVSVGVGKKHLCLSSAEDMNSVRLVGDRLPSVSLVLLDQSVASVEVFGFVIGVVPRLYGSKRASRN